jgi:hypothetical protein
MRFAPSPRRAPGFPLFVALTRHDELADRFDVTLTASKKQEEAGAFVQLDQHTFLFSCRNIPPSKLTLILQSCAIPPSSPFPSALTSALPHTTSTALHHEVLPGHLGYCRFGDPDCHRRLAHWQSR